MNMFDYFRVSELFTNCSDDEVRLCVKNHFCDSLLVLLQFLDGFRGFVETPIVITSAFRSYEHNKRVGGVSTSQHMIGQAIDFKPACMPFSTFLMFFREYCDKSALSQYLGQVIIYNDFIHIGLRTLSHPKLTYYDKRSSKKRN